MMEPNIKTNEARIAEALEAIAKAQNDIAKAIERQNMLLLSITYSKAGEELRNERTGELNVRVLRHDRGD